MFVRMKVEVAKKKTLNKFMNNFMIVYHIDFLIGRRV